MIVEAIDVVTSNKDDDFSKFHAHDSAAGTTLMVLNVIFCALFVYVWNANTCTADPLACTQACCCCGWIGRSVELCLASSLRLHDSRVPGTEHIKEPSR